MNQEIYYADATEQAARIRGRELTPVDATAVRRMQEAGAIHLGHTNMPECAFWWETGNEIYVG